MTASASPLSPFGLVCSSDGLSPCIDRVQAFRDTKVNASSPLIVRNASEREAKDSLFTSKWTGISCCERPERRCVTRGSYNSACGEA